MKIYIILIILTISSSCSFLTKRDLTEADISDLTLDMANFNKKLAGNLKRYKLNNDLTKLTIELYKASIEEKIETSEASYRDFMKNYNPEIKLKTKSNDFIICLKAIQVKIIICDKASTGLHEKVERDMDINIDTYIESLSF